MTWDYSVMVLVLEGPRISLTMTEADMDSELHLAYRYRVPGLHR